jgi:adenine-specific DNA methylase
LNFIQFESAQKLRGGFYTDADIAAFLTRWVGTIRPKRVLEPSCGDGAFIQAIFDSGFPACGEIFACELNAEEAAKAHARGGSAPALTVHVGDFLRWFLFYGQQVKGFDAALGNPPFIRYQYLPEEQQALAEKVFSRFGLPFTRHTNAWVPFVMATVALLREGGRLGMVVPAEIFHITHAASLRRFLAERCSRVLILDPEEIWFTETLQGTVLLLAEKKRSRDGSSVGVTAIPMRSRQELKSDAEGLFQSAPYVNGSTLQGKWMPLFLTQPERELLAQLGTDGRIKRFEEIASVDIGIVTGANDFFLVPDSVVKEFGLERWAHPMFGRSEHAAGLIYATEDHQENRRAGLPTNFLWFQESSPDLLPENVRRYLEKGVAEKLPTRFKCRVRTPWYKVPSVSVAPMAMLKRAHQYPRLLLNTAGAYTTDTAYRIRARTVRPEALVFSFVNSLTCLTAELEGRHYGGGVLELVPSEIERLLVPVVSAGPDQLLAADRAFRASDNPLTFLRHRDHAVLGAIGISKQEQEILFEAAARLRQRRQRVSVRADA